MVTKVITELYFIYTFYWLPSETTKSVKVVLQPEVSKQVIRSELASNIITALIYIVYLNQGTWPLWPSHS